MVFRLTILGSMQMEISVGVVVQVLVQSIISLDLAYETYGEVDRLYYGHILMTGNSVFWMPFCAF